MKKIIVVPVIMILLIVIILTVILASNRDQAIKGSGMIEVQEVQVSAKISGQIKTMLVDEGSSVSKDETLMTLDHRELTAQKKEALAGLNIAEQSLKEVQVKKGDLEKNVHRLRTLHATGDIPDQELENIEMQLAVIQTQEDKAIAGLKAAQARLELVQTQIANAYIISPLSGVVLSKNFEEGENVFPGAQLIRIGNLKTAWLKIYLSEKDMSRVFLGSRAAVSVDAYPKVVFEGKVIWIASEAEFTPKNIQTQDERAQLVFAIKITIPNDQQKLMPGMPADARIIQNGNSRN